MLLKKKKTNSKRSNRDSSWDSQEQTQAKDVTKKSQGSRGSIKSSAYDKYNLSKGD
jgi:hypothetical protein